MFRYEVQSRLEELARQPDDWFALEETGDGAFTIRDASGATATVMVREQWVEIAARRPLQSAARAMAGVGTAASLVRAQIESGGTPGLLVSSRIYLDGFTMQALFLAARDVLALAGPEAAAAAPPSPPPAPPTEALSPPAEPAVEQPPPFAPAEQPERRVPVTAEQPIRSEAPVIAEAPLEPPSEPEPDERAPAQPEPPAPQRITAESDGEPAPAAEPSAAQPEQPLPSVAEPRSVPATIQMSRSAFASPPAPAGNEPATAAPATLPCRRCSQPVEVGEHFCIHCGAPQPPPGAAEAAPVAPPHRPSEPDTVVWRRPPAGMVLCPRCGEANEPENRHCQNCGLALDASMAATPPSESVPAPAAGPSACPRCGYANPPGNRFCQGCGSPLSTS